MKRIGYFLLGSGVFIGFCGVVYAIHEIAESVMINVLDYSKYDVRLNAVWVTALVVIAIYVGVVFAAAMGEKNK
jgi:hypothetical protein